MFKKTRVRGILELLGRNLSAREVAKTLSVSRNTVSEIQALFNDSGKSWDEISDWDDEKLYELFYPDKFKYKPRYAPVDYAYVQKELMKTELRDNCFGRNTAINAKKITLKPVHMSLLQTTTTNTPKAKDIPAEFLINPA